MQTHTSMRGDWLLDEGGVSFRARRRRARGACACACCDAVIPIRTHVQVLNAPRAACSVEHRCGPSCCIRYIPFPYVTVEPPVHLTTRAYYRCRWPNMCSIAPKRTAYRSFRLYDLLVQNAAERPRNAIQPLTTRFRIDSDYYQLTRLLKCVWLW